MTELLKSKKFLTAVLSVVVMLVGEVGLELDIDALLAIVLPLLTFILSQGIADHGKEAEKVKNSQ